ncbi:MAG: NAD(P)-dependent oxidoreductase [Verrucomicrobiota bacterium]
MRIAITGSGGRLGAALARGYRDRHEVTGLDRFGLDLRWRESIEKALGGMEFDILINAAAVTNVDYCELNREEAFLVNEAAVRTMAEICRGKGARMIHVSTDYVFEGEEAGLRAEDDAVGPKSIYGKSKLAGEHALLEVDPEYLVIRTSWVFGPDRRSFLDSIIDRAMYLEGVEAIEDKYSNPTYTLDFVSMLEPFLEENRLGGRLNLCNAGSCSWREYGQAGLDCAAAKGLSLKTRELVGIGLAEMDQFVAPRPVHTAMSVAKYEAESGRKVRCWEEAVEMYIRDYFLPRQGVCVED